MCISGFVPNLFTKHIALDDQTKKYSAPKNVFRPKREVRAPERYTPGDRDQRTQEDEENTSKSTGRLRREAHENDREVSLNGNEDRDQKRASKKKSKKPSGVEQKLFQPREEEQNRLFEEQEDEESDEESEDESEEGDSESSSTTEESDSSSDNDSGDSDKKHKKNKKKKTKKEKKFKIETEDFLPYTQRGEVPFTGLAFRHLASTRLDLKHKVYEERSIGNPLISMYTPSSVAFEFYKNHYSYRNCFHAIPSDGYELPFASKVRAGFTLWYKIPEKKRKTPSFAA
jgi:hypothetical protein